MQFDTQDRGHVQCAGCNPVTAEYAGVPAILAYIMLETGRPEITIRRRSSGWEAETIEGIDADLALPEVGVTISLAAIYAR